MIYSFNRIINVLSSPSSQELGLSTVDELLLLFGHASALIQIGRPEVSFKQSGQILFFVRSTTLHQGLQLSHRTSLLQKEVLIDR